ncbi:MAG: hypothetical protein QXL22_06640 [Candidatus Nezhaarchaeales archaeon]
MLEGGPLAIYYGGTQAREFLDVKDVAEVIERITREGAINIEAYSFGLGVL